MTPAFILFSRSLMMRTRAGIAVPIRMALGGVLLITILLTTVKAQFVAAPGRDLLTSSAWTLAIATMVVAAGWFAAAISEEKEERTVGLLTMAGMTPLAILLAKGGARMWEALLLLASALPVMLLASTLGGVTPTQVLAVFIALATWLALLAALGLFCSVVCRTAVIAGSISGTAIVALCVIDGFMEWDLTVFRRLGEVLATGFNELPVSFGDLLRLATALGLFLGAWLLFPRLVRDDDDGAQEAVPWGMDRLLLPLQRLLPAGRRRLPAGPMAVITRDFRCIHGGWAWQVLRLLLVVIALVVVALIMGADLLTKREHMGAALQIIALVLLAFEPGAFLARSMAVERAGRTLDDLFLLPYRRSSLFWAKLASVAFMLLPIVGLFIVGVALAPVAFASAVLWLLQMGGWLVLVAGLVVGEVLFLWSTSLYLSLHVKRGAFVYAILICIGGTLMPLFNVIGILACPVLAIVFFFLALERFKSDAVIT